MIHIATKIKTLVLAVILACALTVGLGAALPATSHAAGEASKKAACEATGGKWAGNACTNADGTTAESSINNVVKTVINIFSWVVGVVAVIMIIVGGFRFITSNGDAAGVKGARSAILYAIVGLIVVVLAQTIVFFVLNTATKDPEVEARTDQQSCEVARPGGGCTMLMLDLSAAPWYKLT